MEKERARFRTSISTISRAAAGLLQEDMCNNEEQGTLPQSPNKVTSRTGANSNLPPDRDRATDSSPKGFKQYNNSNEIISVSFFIPNAGSSTKVSNN
jgi:hypothetical protein